MCEKEISKMTEEEKKAERYKEMCELSVEMAEREKPIIAAWKAAHPHFTRGTVDSPEMIALREETKRRVMEIGKKYK